MSDERVEEELLHKIDMIQKALTTETKVWRKIYLFQRFFEYFSKLRNRFNHYIIPFINCKYPNRIQSGNAQIGSRVNMERDPGHDNILSAMGSWRDQPENDIFVCDMQQAIFQWMSRMATKSHQFMQEYKRLRKQFLQEFSLEKNKPKSPIYELVMFSNVMWCDREDASSVPLADYNDGKPYAQGNASIGFMLKEVRVFCSKCHFTRPAMKKVESESPCEQWNELVLYFLSLLEIGHSHVTEESISLYETLDWSGKFSYSEAMVILEHPEFWLKKRFDVADPVEVEFNYHAWVLKDYDTLDDLPNIQTIQDKLLQKSNQLLSAIAVALWIISRLSRYVHEFKPQ